MERLTIRLNDQCGNPTDSIILKPYMRYRDEDTEKAILNHLAYYEDLEEQGLLPKFHLGDEFYVPKWCGVVKEKIVMLQQKKDGTWKYRFKSTGDFEESDFGRLFFDTKEEAEVKFEEFKSI